MGSAYDVGFGTPILLPWPMVTDPGVPPMTMKIGAAVHDGDIALHP